MNVSAFIARLKSDFHVPIALGVFVSTSVYHFVSGRDLGSSYVNSLYAFYAFLAGHSFTQEKYNGTNGSSGTGGDSADTEAKS